MAGDPHVIGRRIRIDSMSYLRRWRAAAWRRDRAQRNANVVLVPAATDPDLYDRGNYALRVIGRLKRTCWSIDAATEETAQLLRRIEPPSPNSAIHGARLATLQSVQTRAARQPILILLAAAGLLLLIACANVATFSWEKRQIGGRASGAHGARRESRAARSATPDGKPRARRDRRRNRNPCSRSRHKADGALCAAVVPSFE
jgi:hypothetical protein